jgi:myo-inositol-1(or 4)-monophosphatase
MSNTNFTASEIYAVLTIAQAAAHEAGSYLIQKQGQAKIEYQKSPKDDLLDVDLAAEKIILTKLHQETPMIGTLSEEAGREGSQEQYWIIDPLDGSANFQHSNPTFGIAIALAVGTTTLGSVIYLPMSEEMFTAVHNQGAYLGKLRIRTSQTAMLEDAIIHLGDIMKAGKPDVTSNHLQEISGLFIRSRRIRMIGSAAADLAYIACGRADALVNHAQKAWDREAGKLLVTEAGGKTTEVHRPNRENLFIYSNAPIHQQVNECILMVE